MNIRQIIKVKKKKKKNDWGSSLVVCSATEKGSNESNPMSIE